MSAASVGTSTKIYIHRDKIKFGGVAVSQTVTQATAILPIRFLGNMFNSNNWNLMLEMNSYR